MTKEAAAPRNDERGGAPRNDRRGCVIAPFLWSLRVKRGNPGGVREIAELVPSETRNLMLQFASATPRNDK